MPAFWCVFLEAFTRAKLHVAFPRMECIRKYDIELEKEVYYGGETLKGCVVIENAENLRVNSKRACAYAFFFYKLYLSNIITASLLRM